MPQLCQDALQDYRDSIAKHESSHSLSMTLWAPGLCEKAETSSDHAKIIQVENTNVLLLELSAEHYVGIVAEFGNPLAVVERTTARCMLSVLLHQMCFSLACQRYKCRLRLPNTDDAASNNLCESSVAAGAKHGQWKMMHDLCEVHIVASVYKAMYQLLHVEFQGVLHFALSTKHGAAMNVFRKALRLEIHSRGVRICQGASPKRAKLTMKTWFAFSVRAVGTCSAGRCCFCFCQMGIGASMRSKLTSGMWMQFQRSRPST